MKVQLKRPPKEGAASAREPRTVFEDGKYKAVVSKAEEAEDQYGGLWLYMDIDGKETRLRIFPASEAIRSLLEAADMDVEGQQEAEFDLNELVGLKLNAYLGSRKAKNGQTYNTVKKFSASRG